jgi:hypothetical protein
MKKIVYSLLATLIILLILCAGMIFYLDTYAIRSELLAKQLSKIVYEKSGATLDIGNLKVYAFRQISMDNVKIKTKDGITINIDKAYLHYSFPHLLERKLVGEIILQNTGIQVKQPALMLATLNYLPLKFENITSNIFFDKTRLSLSNIEAEADAADISGNFLLQQNHEINAKFDIIFYPQKIQNDSLPGLVRQILADIQEENIKFLLEISGSMKNPQINITTR